uniref:Adenylate kinase n=1 Tax=Panagrellus redivivus TaxID=6233 RepID=A0A7E4ZZF7_PANRE
MGAEGKRYLQEHSIPQLFEGLMTGLIYSRPDDPLDFIEAAINRVRSNPDIAYTWDIFIQTQNGEEPSGSQKKRSTSSKKVVPKKEPPSRSSSAVKTASKHSSAKSSGPSQHQSPEASPQPPRSMPSAGHTRVPSVTKAADVAKIPTDIPIILFIGGPGGGKTRVATKVRDAMEGDGVVHICMPDLVKTAVTKYKDRFPEWKDAAEKYNKGELIPNHLARDIVKAEMGRHPDAKAYFLEGFPREARQVEDFEKNVRPINMALILDYDEDTLRKHMSSRGMSEEAMEKRINEFKQKTLPSAKYFDDQRLLHLIPGEKDDATILERMRKLITRAMELGVQPVFASPTPTPDANGAPASTSATPAPETPIPEQARVASASKPPTSHSRTSRKSNGSIGSGSRHAPPPPVEEHVATPPKTATPVEAVASKPPSRHPSQPPTASSNRPATKDGTPIPPTPPRESTAPPPAESPAVTDPPSVTQSPEVTVNDVPAAAAIANRPPSSVASTPKPADGPFKDVIDTPMGLDGSRLMTATADKFPKGLPNNAPVILVIGGPGSNKTELAERIAKKYDGFTFLSMGQLLRKKVQENMDDELWQRIGKKMEIGETIPMQICREVLYTAMHEQGANSWGYVIEGYPRTQRQVEELEQQLNRVDVALLIDCTEQYCHDNLTKRYREGLEQGTERKDDDESVISTRLGLFKQNTLPMLRYLDDKSKLKVIDGDNANLDNVFKEVTNVIDNSVFIQDSEGGRSLSSSKQGSVDGDK